jgi:uncharacterized repeat protein (TIGR01451 family)
MPVLSGTEQSPTQVISYSLLISNTGNLAATAAITDLTPSGTSVLTETLAADHGPSPTASGGVILWSDTVPAGESVRLSYALVPTVTLQRGDRFTNTVTIAGSVLGPFERRVVTMYPWQIWLPVIMR